MKKSTAKALKRETKKKFGLAVCWLITVTAILLLASSSLLGQDYESLPINAKFVLPKATGDETREERAQLRQKERQIKGAISAGKKALGEAVKAGSGSFSNDIQTYLREYRIARMTQADEQTLNQLGTLRTTFFKDFMGKSAQPAARRAIVQTILPLLQQIVNGEQFHPAVRVNAVTMVGLLDNSAGSTGRPPVPSPEAYRLLRELITNPNTPEYIRVNAISGVRRFAEMTRRSSSGNTVGADLQANLIAILDGKANGQEAWSEELSYWLKRRATQILGFIGEGDAVVSKVNDVMNGKDLGITRDEFLLRLDGLVAMRNLKFEQVPRAEFDAMVDDAIAFAAYALEREANWVDSQLEDLIYVNILWHNRDLETEGRGRRRNSGGPGRGGGGLGGGGGGLGGGGGGLGGGGGGLGGGGGGLGGGGGGLGGGGGGLGGGGGGLGGGGGGLGGGRGGGFGGGGRRNKNEKQSVELPTFMLNDSRARIKSVLVNLRQFLSNEVSVNGTKRKLGMVQVGSQEQIARIEDDLIPAIDDLLEQTEIGVVDYKKLKDEEPDNKDVTKRLMEIYSKASKELRGLMKNPPKSADAATPGDEAFPPDN